MRKTSFILNFFLLLAYNAFAEGNERSLVVLMKSGTTITLPVSDQPKIQFDGTVMRVGDGDYQIENVRKWMIGTEEEIAAGLQPLPNRDEAISYRDGVLSVGNRKDVRAWNATGIEMPVRLKNGQVDMSAWPQDVYVIKAGSETLKLRKR